MDPTDTFRLKNMEIRKTPVFQNIVDRAIKLFQ